MHVAIIGAGFAGLATCWEALEAGAEVTLFDRGGGASRVSPGLLHPFVGAKAQPDWESFRASCRLLEVAGQTPPRGLVRLLPEPIERDGAQWWDRERIEAELPGCTAAGALYIPDGLRVDTKNYLAALWTACEARGAQLFQDEADPHTLLRDFDRVILCIGSDAAALPNLKITPIKGQILRLRWPQSAPPPKLPILGPKYLLPEGESCLVGSTYERHFTSAAPAIEEAKRLILPQITELYPVLEGAEVLECMAGIRASAPGHYPPLLRELEPRLWIFAGLGSRGLLLHAKMAQELIRRSLL